MPTIKISGCTMEGSMRLESPIKLRAAASYVLALVVTSLWCMPVVAQDFATANPNVNVVGLTPKLEHVPDFQLKQQQEPSCIVRPGKESY